MFLTVKKPSSIPSFGMNIFDEFDDIFNSSPIKSSFRIKDEEEQLNLSLDIPGVKKEDCLIEVKDRVLNVSCKRSDLEEERKESIYLNQDLDIDDADVELMHGVLNITFKKKRKEPKLLQIKE